MELSKGKRVSLKNNPQITEDMIQSFIFDDPNCLGLGELVGIRREKLQPAGGRLDILLGDDNNNRYEVEVQLGATDPSHIIRTIEYWDLEKKRYPQYSHCAVIVAEEITGRFMNVISLFNGSIPLIAYQMSAYETDNGIMLTFTKILDRISYASDEEDNVEITDRKYWEKRSTPQMMAETDKIFEDISKMVKDNYEFKYNKFYIGLTQNGVAKNFVSFTPKKNFLYITVKRPSEVNEIISEFDADGVESKYDSNYNEISVRVANYSEYKKHKEVIDKAIKWSIQYMNIELEEYI